MLVVTAAAPDPGGGRRRSGCLVGFSSQASLDPPLYAVWISAANHTHAVAGAASHLGLHFLARGEEHLARLFGEQTGDAVDKFDRCRWFEGPRGVPVLADCRAWIWGRVLRRWPTGDHTAALVEPLGGSPAAGYVQLGFQSLRSLEPGHPA